MPAAELAFAYRDSRFKVADARAAEGAPRDVVIDATFRLTEADPETIKTRLDEIRHWRQAHQPLGLPSAGSVFRNPDGDSAGRLIEAAGLKGTRIGGAVVSEKHANFIVNDQKGSASDVRRLAERVRAEILARDGVDLRFEIEFVGDWAGWEAGMTVDRRDRPAAGRRPARRPVGRARRLGRVRDRDRRRAGRGGPSRRAGPDRSRRGVVVAAARPPARRTGRRPRTTTRERSARRARSRSARRSTAWRPPGPAPVVAIALHGPFGEDGTIQALLEAAGLAYTGSGVAASAIGMDKTIFKRICRGIGLPVVDWREVTAARWASDPEAVRGELAAFAAGSGEPRLMVKPARLGSSVGMTLVHDPAELDGALDTAFRHDTLALVETYVAGARDLEVAIIGDARGALELYGPGEIVSGHEFYDYAAKYTAGLSETSTHAEVSDRERATLLKIARDAYRAIGGEGFARVDFLVAGETILLSEINTIPGFTPISLFPTMPADGGYTFGDVCSKVVELALDRHAARAGRRLTPADLPR